MSPSRGSSGPPVVGFIDMDCFYVAVERARDKRLHGKPCAVVQYPTGQRGRPDLRREDDRWRTAGAMGGIIAVSYEARAKGVTRQMSGHEAKKVCPEIILVQVPTAFGKADLQIYKEAGDAVVELLAQKCDATEKRSVDEVAIDISSESQRLLSTVDFAELRCRAQRASHLADSALSKAAANVTRSEARQGHQKQQARNVSELADGWEEVFQRFATDLTVQRLIAGAVVVNDLRAEVESMLGFTCSGGVATNKILAKLGCGLHKPNQQTLLLPHAAPVLLKDLPLDRLPGLGGDFGQAVKHRFEVETAGQLLQVSRLDVMKHFPQRGEWLLALVAGEDSAAEAVKDRQLVKSLSNGKTFFGEKRLRSVAEVDYWLGELAGELHRRYQKQVEKHQRTPTTLGVSLSMEKESNAKEHLTRQQSINLGSSGSVEHILTAAKALVRRAGHLSDVVVLGLCLSNMVSLEASGSLTKYFGKAAENAGGSIEKFAKSRVKPKAQDQDQENLLKASFARAAKREAEPIGRMDQEVDEGVLAELPLNIQEEIRKQMGQMGKEPRAKKLCAEIVEIDA